MSMSTISSDSMAESVESSASHGFSEEDPLGDDLYNDSTDVSSRTNKSPSAQVVPTLAPQSPPDLFTPIVQLGYESLVALYKTLEVRTMREPKNTIHPQRTLLPAIKASIAWRIAASPSPSPPLSPLSPLSSSSPLQSPARSRPSRKRSRPLPSPSRKRCRSPSPAALTLVELALAAPALPSIPIELLPPHKRFGTIKRIETAKREIESLQARLAVAEIQIGAHQREEIGKDIREVGYRAQLWRIEDTLRRDR
ncbi:hypothetical protein Tco_0576881 [Tanacetum coccineum]